jgi:hypothetical protein
VSVLMHGARLVYIGDSFAASTPARSSADAERARNVDAAARASLPPLTDAAPPAVYVPREDETDPSVLCAFPAWSLETSDDSYPLFETDCDEPPKIKALAYLHAHASEVEAALVDGVFEYLSEDDPDLERDALPELLKLRRVCVQNESARETSYLVFWLDAEWETDDGMTVAMHRDRVLAVGFGNEAFASVPGR